MVEHFAVRYVQLDATPFIQPVFNDYVSNFQISLCQKSTDSAEKDFCLKNVKLDT